MIVIVDDRESRLLDRMSRDLQLGVRRAALIESVHQYGYSLVPSVTNLTWDIAAAEADVLARELESRPPDSRALFALCLHDYHCFSWS